MTEHKVEVQETVVKNDVVLSEDQREYLVETLVQLARTKKFRSAINLLRTNAGEDHAHFYNAGVVLQHLSNQYGDIGDLQDECFLQKELEQHANKVVELLL